MYLDYNATSPLLPEVEAAMSRAYRSLWANSSSPHGPGRAAAEGLEQGREQVAQWLDRPPSEVCFTSGATESNASALRPAVDEHRPVRLVSAIEHPSVLTWGTHRVRVDREGLVDLDELADLLKTHGASVGRVSIMAANNETGVLQPVEEIAEICRSHGVPYHCDATQVPSRARLNLQAPDLISLSAHKFGGPKGVGVLCSRLEVSGLLRGGSQEQGRRAGTVNVPGAVGMGMAASLATPQTSKQRDRLEAACLALGGQVASSGAPRLPNTCCVIFPVPGDLLVMALDLAGVYCSTGSACASGAPSSSPVLQAMGIQGIPVRFSLGPDSDVSKAIGILEATFRQVESACGSSLQ